MKLAVIQKTGIEPRLVGLIDDTDAEILMAGESDSAAVVLYEPADMRAVVGVGRSPLGTDNLVVENAVTMLPYHETTVDLSAVAEYTVLSLEGQDGGEVDRIVTLYQEIRGRSAPPPPKKERHLLTG